jgi:hypothetical protein
VSNSSPSLSLRDELSRSAVLSAYSGLVYVAMEWLFTVTKPSYMSSFELSGTLGSLFLPALALMISAISCSLAMTALLRLPGLLPAGAPGTLVPGLILGTLAFLMMDNFIYTFSGFGVISSGGISRIAMLGAYIVILRRSFAALKGQIVDGSAFGTAPLRWGWIAPLMLVAALAGATQLGRNSVPVAAVERATSGQLPNIIVVTADAIESRFTSLHGYGLKTTPFLEELAKESLVVENAFTNASKTTGALTALWTGKYPHRVKVGFPPQVLPREHAFEHLPALLRGYGYTGFQRTVRWYADAEDLNMQMSFDQANGRALLNPALGSAGLAWSVRLNSEYMFVRQNIERVWKRLMHIFFVKNMINHFLLVAENEGISVAWDRQSLNDALAFLKSAEGPAFIHVHLMASHPRPGIEGLEIRFKVPAVKATGVRKDIFRITAMVNMILDVDDLLADFYRALIDADLLENSILVVASDHSNQWDSMERVPLLIRFPDAAHAGWRDQNASLLDVAPTLLDALEVPKPDWMDGHSLLGPRRESGDVIYTLGSFVYERFYFMGRGVLSRMNNPGPPLYGVSEFAAIVCDRYFGLNLESGELAVHEIDGHTAPCEPGTFPSDEAMKEQLLGELIANGFSPGF